MNRLQMENSVLTNRNACQVQNIHVQILKKDVLQASLRTLRVDTHWSSSDGLTYSGYGLIIENGECSYPFDDFIKSVKVVVNSFNSIHSIQRGRFSNKTDICVCIGLNVALCRFLNF